MMIRISELYGGPFLRFRLSVVPRNSLTRLEVQGLPQVHVPAEHRVRGGVRLTHQLVRRQRGQRGQDAQWLSFLPWQQCQC